MAGRAKLFAEFEPGVPAETDPARIERDAHASMAGPGLRLGEAKRLTAALQALLVPAQAAALGACRRARSPPDAGGVSAPAPLIQAPR